MREHAREDTAREESRTLRARSAPLAAFACCATVSPMLPSRDSALRRRLAYPILTLTMAGIVYLFSRGQIATTPPAPADAYIAAARQAVSDARSGGGMSNAADGAIDVVYRAQAPSALTAAEGETPTIEVVGASLPEGERPWIQDVAVRLNDGSSITLSISIKDGVTQVVGVKRGSAPARDSATLKDGTLKDATLKDGTLKDATIKDGTP